MSKEELLQKIAELEFTNDQLISELRYLDKLMRSVGFSDGIATVKATAQELIDHDESEDAGLEEAA